MYKDMGIKDSFISRVLPSFCPILCTRERSLGIRLDNGHTKATASFMYYMCAKVYQPKVADVV